MRFLKKILFVLTLCGVALAASAEPKNGVDYRTLATPQNTDSGKKIEVTEFFAYYCPHCHAFEPALAAWVKKQGERIFYKRVHVPRDENVLPQQRLFYTLESMGQADKLHNQIFTAMHIERQRLNRDELVFDFIEKHGIDRKKFIEAYRSFGVAAKVRRADAMMEAYKIDSWPMLAIDGRFLTSPSLANQGLAQPQTEAQQQTAALSVADFLVAKAAADKK